jgi:DNA-binding response OmpR family regulator
VANQKGERMSRKGNNRKKILLVEDEPVVGRLFKRILNIEGFDVDFVRDGRVAIEAVNKNHYDLCISDIRLPSVTGIQLYEHLKVNYPQLSLHTVFITGDTMNANIQMFLQESGMPCLVKPFNPEDLVATVKGLLK